MPTKRRRAHGEGTVYLRGDKRWAGVATLTDGRRKFVYSQSQAGALTKLRQVIDARDRGLPISPSHRFSDFAEEWLTFKRSSIGPRTLARYEQLIRIHLAPRLGRRRLQSIVPTDMTTLYGEMMAAGLSPTTVRHVHVVARAMMPDAMRWNYIHRNAVALAKPPKAAPKDMAILTVAEVQTLLHFGDQTPVRALWRLALGTALRSGELLALRWCDLDLDRKELSVNHTLHDLRDGNWRLGVPKSARSKRKIGITSSLVEELRSHRRRQNELMLELGPAHKNHEFVFERKDGRPFAVYGMKRHHLAPILKLAKLPAETRVHDLRHTAISHAIAQGVPIADVSMWAGHAISITLSVYAHAMPDATKRTTEAVGQALGI